MKRSTVSVKTFLQWITPCDTGEEYLKGFGNMRDAWMSPDAEPDDMLWVLASLPYISWSELRKFALRLVDTKLTFCSCRADLFFPRCNDSIIEHGQVFGRYHYIPVVGKIRVTSRTSRERTPQERAQQQDFIRAGFPDMFKETDKQFVAKLKGAT